MENIVGAYAQSVEQKGISFRPNSPYNVSSGYMVSLSGWEEVMPIEQYTAERLTEYVQRNHKLLMDLPTVWVGVWLDEETQMVHLDLSNNYDNKEAAVRAGIAGNQLAIWDVLAADEIRLPEPQRSGTMTQQQTYINMKVREILENGQTKVVLS